MTTSTTKVINKKYSMTVFLLCIGYFIDFYDLTLFSAGYTNIIQDLFHVYDKSQIQILYLNLTNFFTAGILIGSLSFGIVGDKFGRVTVIRYSILLYSISIIWSIFTHSITLFMLLRFLSGVGLAAEFATSSTLLSELLPTKLASKATAMLYFCGILGGMCATFLSIISWQVMFLFGSISGFILYLFRKRLVESELFLNQNPNKINGNLWQLINRPAKFVKLIKFLIIILPFNFLISIMFIYPSFMPINGDLSHLIHLLLLGFFIGNIISTIISYYFISFFKNYHIYLFISIIFFAIIMALFKIINQELFFAYSILLGLLGGGYPTVWIQLATRSFGTNQRSTASNTLFALGRSSGIGFNLMIAHWIKSPQFFEAYATITTLIISSMVILVLVFTKNNYGNNMNYIEN